MKQRKQFKHLSFTQRLQISAFLKVKTPIPEIAKQIGVHRATIYRELHRGVSVQRKTKYDFYGDKNGYYEKEVYNPDAAEQLYRESLAAKGAPLKIGKDFALADYIENKIVNEKRSPDSVIGEIKRMGLYFKTSICTTTLYSYIYKGVFLTLSMEHLHEKGKHKKRKHNSLTISRPPKGTSIERRPENILLREEFGHWEMDSVCGSTKSAFLVMTERMTRKEIIFPMPNQKAESVISCLDYLERKYGDLFHKVFLSITVDNGSEFSAFEKMEQSSLGNGKRTTIYYCHPYSFFERGCNERMNREIRRLVPKGSDLSKFSMEDVQKIEDWLNSYPRKILGYATPQELFDRELEKLS